jgi:hypothetical protein
MVEKIELLCKAIDSVYSNADKLNKAEKVIEDLQDFAIWMTGCGYDFCQHDYFCQKRDELLKGGNENLVSEVESGMEKEEMKMKDVILAWAVRRQILLGQESVDDLAREIVRLTSGE